MPPRVVHGPNQAGGLGAFVESLPPVTRFMAGTIFAVSLGMYVGLVHPATLALFWPAITKNYQIWRLATCHFVIPFSMTFVFLMLFLLKYGANLETEVYRFAPADFVFMLICGAAFLVAVPPLVGFPLPLTAPPLILMLIYVWSRNFPDTPVSLYGLVTIQAFYLPFAFLFLTVVMGGSPVADLFGIAAGHLWYFFTDLYPRSSGRELLRTPRLLKAWVSNLGVGPAPSPAEAQQRAAFRGRGQRLGAS